MKTFGKTVLLYELTGFGLVILLLWMNEVFDLPSLLFGAPSTPINWIESIMETVGVVVLAGAVSAFTLNYIRQIKYLEGFLPVCAFCKRIRVRDRWIPIEVYISDHTQAVFSHGYCPECREKYYKKHQDPGQEV